MQVAYYVAADFVITRMNVLFLLRNRAASRLPIYASTLFYCFSLAFVCYTRFFVVAAASRDAVNENTFFFSFFFPTTAIFSVLVGKTR